MRVFGLILILALAGATFVGCSGSAPTGNLSPLSDASEIAALERAVAQDNMSVLTPERYRAVRGNFIDEMSTLLAEREKQSSSYVRRSKNLVARLGALLGLTGTVASFAVNDEDTKQTFAQTSALVASVSAVVALIPLGNPPKGAAATRKYLEVELPAFRSRWPASPESPLEKDAWTLFLGDMRRTEMLLTKFSQ